MAAVDDSDDDDDEGRYHWIELHYLTALTSLKTTGVRLGPLPPSLRRLDFESWHSTNCSQEDALLEPDALELIRIRDVYKEDVWVVGGSEEGAASGAGLAKFLSGAKHIDIGPVLPLSPEFSSLLPMAHSLFLINLFNGPRVAESCPRGAGRGGGGACAGGLPDQEGGARMGGCSQHAIMAGRGGGAAGSRGDLRRPGRAESGTTDGVAHKELWTAGMSLKYVTTVLEHKERWCVVPEADLRQLRPGAQKAWRANNSMQRA